MSPAIAALLGIGDSELVALVGGGGKTTLLFSLAHELVAAGHRVALTTTTRLGSEEVAAIEMRSVSARPEDVARAVRGPGPVAIVVADDGRKIAGPTPGEIDALFDAGVVDHVLVEADGARRRPFKAPAAHEPVVPRASTLVVVVMGAEAIGEVIAEVCHRPERVAELAAVTVNDRLDVAACVAVLGHPDGGLKGVPAGARVILAITKVTASRRASADEIALRLRAHQRIERVVLL